MEAWTEREDTVLRAGYERGKTAPELAEMLGRTPGAVRGRASALGLKKGEAIQWTEPDAPGACRFCGQICIDTDDRAFTTQAERNEEATYKCGCPEAKKERKTMEQIGNAHDRIVSLFGSRAPDYGFSPVENEKAIDYMKAAVEFIARVGGLSVQIQLDRRCKAKISTTTTGAIKVGRTETTKYQLEE